MTDNFQSFVLDIFSDARNRSNIVIKYHGRQKNSNRCRNLEWRILKQKRTIRINMANQRKKNQIL